MRKLLILIAASAALQSSAFAAILPVGATLFPQQKICSANDKFCLVLQPSTGNLEFYSVGGQVLWSSNTAGKGVTRAVMQPDGKLVLFNSADTPVWALDAKHFNAYLSVQDDGNLAFYWDRAVWSSDTSDPARAEAHVARILLPPARLTAGSSYSIGQYFLILQADGNLVLFRDGAQIWNSATAGNGVTFAAMQPTGNFALVNDAGAPVWSTGTAGNSGAYFAFQPDGNLAVYEPMTLWDRLSGYRSVTKPDGKWARVCPPWQCVGSAGSIITLPF